MPLTCISRSISAIFTWQLLEDKTLTRPGVIQLPGNPLDITTSTTDSAAHLAVALHIPEGSDAAATAAARSLHIIRLTMDDGRLAVDTIAPVQDDTQEVEEQDVPEADVRTLFYTVEHLRKQPPGGTEEGGEEPQGDVAEE